MKKNGEVQIPYGEFELISSYAQLSKMELNREKLQTICSEITSIIPREAWDLKKIAEEKEISFYWLINSPRYKRLFGKYYDCLAENMPEKIKTELKITDVQAWALMLYMTGIIEH